jgi:hypothetical protein
MKTVEPVGLHPALLPPNREPPSQTKGGAMVRWLTSVLAILFAATLLAAQAPAEQQKPEAQQPAAQQPAQQQPAQQQPASPAQTAQANKVTYTGCLKPGATAQSWILEESEMASAAGATAKPGEKPAGTSGTATKTTLNLGLGGKGDDTLKPHANHKVEIVGTMGAASAAGAAPGGAAPGAAPSTPPRQTLNVESVKMIAATCP